MRQLLGLLALCLGFALVMDAPAQQGETRIALVIGNDSYSSLPGLPGARRDAAILQAALVEARFQVTARTNLDRAHLRDELATFARRLSALGSNGVGFIYYAGHGAADGPRGRNYLIPVDANVQSTTDLALTSIALDEALDALENAHARTTIIVIDACRTAIGRAVGRGLAPMDARTDTIIGFSTGPGDIAGDDGIYARTLAAEMVRPGEDAEVVFARVQRAVGAATARHQIPEYRSRLVEPIVFVSANVAGAQVPPVTTSQRAPMRQAASVSRPGEAFRDCDECPEMVVIPAGSFLMGSPLNEPNRQEDEGRQRLITFARNFAVGRTEITLDQYAAFVSATGYADGAECRTDHDVAVYGVDGRASGTWRNPGFPQNQTHPVVCVSWDDAQAYVGWLDGRARASAMTRSAGATRSYRLLSESEWEYVARAGTTGAYWWGTDGGAGCGHANLADAGLGDRAVGTPATCNDGFVQTAPVGSFHANAFGLRDMMGNVGEWVEDCFLDVSLVPSDGSANSPASCLHRVFRGGGWAYSPQFSRIADRYSDTHSAGTIYLGFRVARTL